MICEPRNSRLGLFGKEPKQEEEIEARPAYTASPTSLDKLIDQMFTNGQTMNKLAEQIWIRSSVNSKFSATSDKSPRGNR